jgi:hypothetical protein
MARSGFKMKGWGGYQNSPMRKDKKQVALSKEEKEKGTVITGGNKSEEMIDLEDRIEFLNSDIAEESSTIKRGKMITQRNKLKSRLKQMMK